MNVNYPLASYEATAANRQNYRADKFKTKKPRREVKVFDKVLAAYRRLYKGRWDDRSTAVKSACMKRAIVLNVTEIYTADVFYREFARRMDILLDSRRFIAACKQLGFAPRSVATHGWPTGCEPSKT